MISPSELGEEEGKLVSAGELDDVRERIEAIRRARGYVLPSHAVLSATYPSLLSAYEEIFSEMTYRFKVLTPFQKHFVWLLVIGALEARQGEKHVEDFLNAGGTVQHVECAAALAALVIGAKTLDAIGPSWESVVPGLSAAATYFNAIEKLSATAPRLPSGLLQAGLATASACQRSWHRFDDHLIKAKVQNCSDAAICEALSIVILPGGNPIFSYAAKRWRNLVQAGTITASVALRHAFQLIGE